MQCSTNIVDCLRKKGTEPYAFASSEESSSSVAANAIDGTTSKSFFSKPENSPQWWAVDFKRLVSINGYKVTTDTTTTTGSAIYNWTLSVSFNKRNWRVINYPPGGSRNKVISLGNSFIGRYARIDGNSLWKTDKTKIAIFEIEFYGSHIARMKVNTCAVSRKKIISIYLIILLIVS